MLNLHRGAKTQNKQSLGSGTFGDVKVVNGNAEKSFYRINHLLQEYVTTKYLQDSPYIIELVGYDLEKLVMRSRVYSMSLKDALENQNIKFEFVHYFQIFTECLIGLDHMHSRNITHADFKPSNILLNLDPLEVRICDLGLSSTIGYSRINQTAKVYRPPDEFIGKGNETLHDLYCAAVIGIEMFGYITIVSQIHPNKLPYIVDDAKIDQIPHRKAPRVAAAIKLLGTLDINVNSAHNALRKMGVKSQPLHFHPIPSLNNFLDERDISTIREWMKNLSQKTWPLISKEGKFVRTQKLSRVSKGLEMIYRRLTCKTCPPVDRSDHYLYTIAAALILASLFGCSAFSKGEAMEELAYYGRWNYRSLLSAVSSYINCMDILNFIMSL